MALQQPLRGSLNRARFCGPPGLVIYQAGAWVLWSGCFLRLGWKTFEGVLVLIFEAFLRLRRDTRICGTPHGADARTAWEAGFQSPYWSGAVPYPSEHAFHFAYAAYVLFHQTGSLIDVFIHWTRSTCFEDFGIAYC